MGTTLDEPLYHVNSTHILACTGLRFYLIFTHSLKACQVFGAVAGEKFSVDIDNNTLDITLNQFFLFNTFFFFFYPFYIRACYLVSTVCLWFQEVNLHTYEDRVKVN